MSFIFIYNILIILWNEDIILKNSNKKAVALIFLAWIVYLISYLGRSDYNSCMIEIINQTGVANATAALVTSTFSICNAIGQLVSAFIVAKVSPIKIIGIELFLVASINLLFPATDSFVIMAILWGINGFMQSTLLSGITKIFVLYLKEPYISRGSVLLNTIGAVGGMFNYVLSWMMIKYFNWQTVFLTVSTLLFILGITWCFVIPKLTGRTNIEQKAEEKKQPKTKVSIFKTLGTNGALFAIIGGFFIGALRESVSLWVPSYMNDFLGLSRTYSILITALIPCLQICGAFLGGFIGNRTSKLFFASFVTFSCSGFSLLGIRILGGSSIVFSLICFIINAVCMTAALTFILSLYPIRFFKKETTVILVGIINFAVHLGDFVSSFGIGWISQNFGWNSTFITLFFTALTAAVICIFANMLNKKAVD